MNYYECKKLDHVIWMTGVNVMLYIVSWCIFAILLFWKLSCGCFLSHSFNMLCFSWVIRALRWCRSIVSLFYDLICLDTLGKNAVLISETRKIKICSMTSLFLETSWRFPKRKLIFWSHTALHLVPHASAVINALIKQMQSWQWVTLWLNHSTEWITFHKYKFSLFIEQKLLSWGFIQSDKSWNRIQSSDTNVRSLNVHKLTINKGKLVRRNSGDNQNLMIPLAVI